MTDDTSPSTPHRIGRMPDYGARKAPTNIWSPLHDFVDETLKMWNDKAAFGTWLGVCKRSGLSVDRLRQIRDGMRDATGIRNKGAVFFAKVKEEKARQTV